MKKIVVLLLLISAGCDNPERWKHFVDQISCSWDIKREVCFCGYHVGFDEGLLTVLPGKTKDTCK